MQTEQPKGGEYVVVARRYRPGSFTDLVGQAHVSTALKNAIATGRVGHAYLFTGARGVGKTSTARILAKCLNCKEGPTAEPCGGCDNCVTIGTGEDVDVIEIDGASNRGVDEIRQLRANVNIRPSRSRYKIYIIDEVHMLTREAFNALLKTLEEPPEHVKFIFCTTDPEKIPITVISRCQKFDFAGIRPDSIQGRLREICESEGVEAEDEALKVLARRAGGSMRDSQSLLEQLLSFGGDKITASDVHDMLGTAQGGQISDLAEKCIARDAAGALASLDAAIGQGVDVGQLNEQLLGYFRDMMAAAVGAESDVALHTGDDDWPRLQELAGQFGLETILATVQILDQTAVRMRQSSHGRMLAEMALVRVCNLENLDQIRGLINQVQGGATIQPTAASVRPVPPATRRVEPAARSEPAAAPQPVSSQTTQTADIPAHEGGDPAPTRSLVELTQSNAAAIWSQIAEEMGGMAPSHARRCSRIANSGPNSLEITIPAAYTSTVAFYENQNQRAELNGKLRELTGQTVSLAFVFDESQPANSRQDDAEPRVPKSQLKRQAANNETVRRVMEKFDAAVDDVTPGQ